ncbi:MAG: class I SAM-dependent methyltransferase [Planctomycetota bacterium]
MNDTSGEGGASHIHSSMQIFRRSRTMAREYDSFYAGTRLLAYDTEYLDRHTAAPGRLLDLGCGTGRHVVHFARRGFDVTGIDLSEHMIEETRKKLSEHGVGATLAVGDIMDLSALADGSFRYCISMFSTVGLIRGRGNRSALLREVSRVLAPGGLFLFHVHNRLYNAFEPLGRRWLLFTYLFGPMWNLEVGDKIMDGYRGIPNMFLHIFSEREVRGLVRASGLRLVELFRLSRERDRELPGRWARSWRANGFLVAARKE